jgi:hypothetical protein
MRRHRNAKIVATLGPSAGEAKVRVPLPAGVKTTAIAMRDATGYSSVLSHHPILPFRAALIALLLLVNHVPVFSLHLPRLVFGYAG